MADPDIAQRFPYMAELPAGDYLWCSCGRSKNQPFCDNSHAGTEFRPVRFRIEPHSRREMVWLCGCKRTKTRPFCDGSHNQLP